MPSVFLAHSHKNRRFTHRLASQLIANAIHLWVDEAELRIGDSLILKIQAAIEAVDYLAVVLSPHAVASGWVTRELEMALTDEIAGRRITVIPILWRHCKVPGFLRGRLYANFTNRSAYSRDFPRLVYSLRGWQNALDRTRLVSHPYNRRLPSRLLEKLSPTSKRIWRYVFQAVLDKKIPLRSTHWMPNSLRIDLPVPNFVVGNQSQDIAGLELTVDEAHHLLSLSPDGTLGLSSTGSALFAMLQPWHVHEDQWLTQWQAHTGPYEEPSTPS